MSLPCRSDTPGLWGWLGYATAGGFVILMKEGSRHCEAFAAALLTQLLFVSVFLCGFISTGLSVHACLEAVLKIVASPPPFSTAGWSCRDDQGINKRRRKKKRRRRAQSYLELNLMSTNSIEMLNSLEHRSIFRPQTDYAHTASSASIFVLPAFVLFPLNFIVLTFLPLPLLLSGNNYPALWTSCRSDSTIKQNVLVEGQQHLH